MKIRSIEAFKIPALSIRTGLTEGGARRAPWQTDAEVANPMSRYPRYKALRASWTRQVRRGRRAWSRPTTAPGASAPPATASRRSSLINDHLGPLLVDENADGDR